MLSNAEHDAPDVALLAVVVDAARSGGNRSLFAEEGRTTKFRHYASVNRIIDPQGDLTTTDKETATML